MRIHPATTFALVSLLPFSGMHAGETLPENTYTTRSFTQGPARIVSPEVDNAGNITFHLKAPEAKEVELNFGEWEVKPRPLTRDEKGVWHATVADVPTGIYHYTYNVDGVRMVDPTNGRIKKGVALDASVVEVTRGTARVDQSQNVPHGVLHVHTYSSSSLGTERKVVVYTPPGYSASAPSRYPVLYLRHGGGDTESSWTDDGRAHLIADNLIQSGQARPMLIVMTNGMVDRTWAGSTSPEAINKLEQELLQDVIPLIENSYAVSRVKDDRAIAGLSMGGGHAFVMGLRNLDTFSWIAQFSSGLLADRDTRLGQLVPSAWEVPDEVNQKVHLLFIACGRADPRFLGHQHLLQKLHDRGIHAQWHETDGGHEWKVWRENLAVLLPKLFTPVQP